MDVIINKLIEKVSNKRLKTIAGNIHAVIADVEDENSEILVALSVLEDKNEFKFL